MNQSNRFCAPLHPFLSRATLAIALAAGLACSTTGCADDDGRSTTDESKDEPAEETKARPRVVMTYDGGIVVLDATTLEVLADFELDGFNRLNSVGDERHVAVSTSGGWALVDAGAWTEEHGDHAHYYSAPPSLSDIIVEAETPAHVVVHDGYTVLFDDGTGEVKVVEVDEWTHAVEEGHAHFVREFASAEAHHGVAVLSKEGHMLVTLSDRSGAMLLDGDDDVIVENSSCPGVHGETAFDSADGTEIMMVGCEDGVLVFNDGKAVKIDSPDDYGRIGNQFSTEGSDIVLGDYRNDPDAGIAVSLIALIHVGDESLEVVDPFEGDEVATTWRGLRRGENGEVLVLGTDGALRVIDPETGDVQHTIDVIEEWEVPDEWQTAHPALEVVAGKAYITEPSTGSIYVVDYEDNEVESMASLDIEMNEIVGLEG